MKLVACTTCSRHVKPSSAECPFCQTPIGAFTVGPARTHMTRAAWVAGAASVVGVVAACSSSGEPVYGAVPMYGAAIYDSSTNDGKADGPVAFDAAYGGPPFDAAVDASDASADATDAKPADSGKD